MNYNELTDEQINRRIAELLGYRVEWRDDAVAGSSFDEYEVMTWDKPGHVLIKPDGTYHERDEDGQPYGEETEDEAWHHAGFWASNPFYALELLNGLPWCAGVPGRFIPIDPKPTKPFFCQIDYGIQEKPGLYQLAIRVEADTLFRAICEAWIAWREAQE